MENNVGVIIGKRLSELFSRIDVRQKDLAEYLDVCPNMISYFKNGSRVPSTEQMIMIADFFGVSLDYLTGLLCVIIILFIFLINFIYIIIYNYIFFTGFFSNFFKFFLFFY